MKYMTLAWWSGEVDRSTADEYGPYFASIKGQLPPAVRRLHDDISLHDAKLRQLSVDLATETVRVQLDGYDWQPDKLPDAERQFTLTYSGVVNVTTTGDPERGLGGPHGFGDLGYDELELLGDGLIEHRMLFSTGIELHIRFRGLAIDLGPVTRR